MNWAALVGMSFCSPVAVAFMLAGDASVYITHSLSEYVPDVMNPSPFDIQLVLLLGNDLTSVTAIVVHDSTTLRCNKVHVYDVPYLTGANGHLAAAPVHQHKTQVNGTANTSALRGLKLCLLPPTCHQAALTHAVNGRMTTLQFYAYILQAPLASVVPGEAAMFEQVACWWRLACHWTAGAVAVAGVPHNTIMTTTMIPGTLPVHATGLTQHVKPLTAPLLAKLGHGGPALTTAAFNAGVVAMEEAVAANRATQNALAIRNDNVTVTIQCGAAVTQELCNICYVDNEAGLPGIWAQLANCNKTNATATVASYVGTHFLAANTGLSPTSIPIITTPVLLAAAQTGGLRQQD